jgi:Leucine-rich repeat (LRR) protein
MNMITFHKLKFGSLVLGVLLLIGLALPLPAIAEGSVSFPDPNLEAVIRETINKPSGDITLADVQNITEFDASYREITSIEGLQYLTNLEVLILYNNQIHDISPLRDLKKFKKLYLSDNPITDYSPIYDIYPTLPARDFTIDPSALPSQDNQSSIQGDNTTENVSCGTKKNPTVIVEGKLLSFEVPPYLKDGATMVPIRAISDALGVKVQWDKKSSTITLAKSSTKILLTIGKKNATANGKSVKKCEGDREYA